MTDSCLGTPSCPFCRSLPNSVHFILGPLVLVDLEEIPNELWYPEHPERYDIYRCPRCDMRVFVTKGNPEEMLILGTPEQLGLLTVQDRTFWR